MQLNDPKNPVDITQSSSLTVANGSIVIGAAEAHKNGLSYTVVDPVDLTVLGSYTADNDASGSYTSEYIEKSGKLLVIGKQNNLKLLSSTPSNSFPLHHPLTELAKSPQDNITMCFALQEASKLAEFLDSNAIPENQTELLAIAAKIRTTLIEFQESLDKLPSEKAKRVRV